MQEPTGPEISDDQPLELRPTDQPEPVPVLEYTPPTLGYATPGAGLRPPGRIDVVMASLALVICIAVLAGAAACLLFALLAAAEGIAIEAVPLLLGLGLCLRCAHLMVHAFIFRMRRHHPANPLEHPDLYIIEYDRVAGLLLVLFGLSIMAVIALLFPHFYLKHERNLNEMAAGALIFTTLTVVAVRSFIKAEGELLIWSQLKHIARRAFRMARLARNQNSRNPM